jgi:hypothetical protein
MGNQEEVIESLILTVALGADWRAEFARRWSLLPVYGDIGGVLAINELAQVFEWGHDSELPPDLVSVDGMKLMALSCAASQYSELRSLQPTPPPGAPSCVRCSGSGWLAIGEVSVRCGDCYGLGWHAA